MDPGNSGVQRPVVVDLRITVEQLGGVQQERDIERVERFRLAHAAWPRS
jgi:hypothetical protein